MTELALPPYIGGSATRRKLQETIDKLRLEMSPEDAKALEDVKVREGEQDVDPILTPILITIIANVGSDVIRAAWRRLKAKVEDELGDNAIGEESEDGSETDH
jgi:hypothetical protein